MKKLVAAAATVAAVLSAAQAASKIPDNTLACADFKKNPDGSWTAAKEAKFTFAGFQVDLKAGSQVTNNSYFYDNNRLIDAVNAKCGG